MLQEFGTLPVIAEDLGLITPEVNLMRKECGFPRMKVLQFAFENDWHQPFLPHNVESLSVIYTGTHDNNTTRGWWKEASPELRRNVCRYLGIESNEENIKIVNYYAFSKYSGELAASLVPSTIIRTNFFGKSLCSGRDSFSDWAYKSLLKGDDISVFDDVLFNPLSFGTLIQFIQLILSKPVVGTFNLGSKKDLQKGSQKRPYIWAPEARRPWVLGERERERAREKERKEGGKDHPT